MGRAAAVLAVLALAGCGGSGAGSGRPAVVASFYPLAWVAERVSAPGARVVDLTPAGAEPHDLELTPGDLEAVHDARLLLYLGRGFQPAVEKAAQERSGPSLDLLGAHLRAAPEGGDEETSVDPHVWLDPTRLERMTTSVGAALRRPLAARRLVGQLQQLDRAYRSGLSRCRRREIVTSHAAFGYLADRYGLRQVALTGLSPEAEATPRRLESLVDQVRRTHATVVFSETLVSPRLAQTIAREAGVSTGVLDPIEGLTKDELSARQDYLSVMRSNLVTLRKALGCR